MHQENNQLTNTTPDQSVITRPLLHEPQVIEVEREPAENQEKGVASDVLFLISATFSKATSLFGSFVLMYWFAKLDPDALPASNHINTLQSLIMSSAAAMLFPAGNFIAQTAKGDKKHRAGKIICNGIILSTFSAIPAILVGQFSSPILTTMGQDRRLALITQNYFREANWGVVPALWFNAEQQVIMGTKKSGILFITSVLSSGSNLFLAYGLMFGKFGLPNIGMSGLGYAFSISSILNCFLQSIYLRFSSTFSEYNLLRFNCNDEPEHIQSNLSFLACSGLPLVMMTACELISSQASTIMAGNINKDALSAQQITLQYIYPILIPLLIFAQAGGILVSDALGSSDYLAAKNKGNKVCLAGILFPTIALILFCSMPTQLDSVFIDTSDPRNSSIVSLTKNVFIITGFGQIIDIARCVFAANLRSYNENPYAMYSTLTTLIAIGLPLGYGLGFGLNLGLEGIALARLIAVALGAGLLFDRWYYRTENSVEFKQIPVPETNPKQSVISRLSSCIYSCGSSAYSYCCAFFGGEAKPMPKPLPINHQNDGVKITVDAPAPKVQ